jgi:hypothetical protein
MRQPSSSQAQQDAGQQLLTASFGDGATGSSSAVFVANISRGGAGRHLTIAQQAARGVRPRDLGSASHRRAGTAAVPQRTVYTPAWKLYKVLSALQAANLQDGHAAASV